MLSVLLKYIFTETCSAFSHYDQQHYVLLRNAENDFALKLLLSPNITEPGWALLSLAEICWALLSFAENCWACTCWDMLCSTENCSDFYAFFSDKRCKRNTKSFAGKVINKRVLRICQWSQFPWIIDDPSCLSSLAAFMYPSVGRPLTTRAQDTQKNALCRTSARFLLALLAYYVATLLCMLYHLTSLLQFSGAPKSRQRVSSLWLEAMWWSLYIDSALQH